MTPSIPFLQKVEAGKVYAVRRYDGRGNGVVHHRGGEDACLDHVAGGFIEMRAPVTYGQRSFATLTPAGRAVLAEDEGGSRNGLRNPD